MCLVLILECSSHLKNTKSGKFCGAYTLKSNQKFEIDTSHSRVAFLSHFLFFPSSSSTTHFLFSFSFIFTSFYLGLILGRVGSSLLWPETRPDWNQVWLPETRPDPKNQVCNLVGFSGLGLDFFFFFYYCCFLSMSLYNKCYYIPFCNNNLSIKKKKKNPILNHLK